ncbi:hypothetical protein MCUN1_003031 [Malassezia cuniculi]|uniref:BZIP domain-containing protein n=1 Tax=Malassezia cuniculi TaxID=948313 RepID=A0AAF0EW62_9BASI|nr:hypothetical protein MCUN1_003031 [Malassezia cuniculi]
MDDNMSTLFPKLEWDVPLDIPPDVKPGADLPFDLGLSLPSAVPGPGSLEGSEWSDASPTLGDSLFSLDFDTSEASPLDQSVVTPEEPPIKRARISQDFTLFPDAEPSISAGRQDSHASVLSLLEGLDNAQPQRRATEPSASPEKLMSASVPMPARSETGRRRRRDASDLLPLDAPVQPRRYLTQSATSRRDAPCEEIDSSSDQADARSQKRLSNTLAARRSRHRKAEELKRLYETIESLREEVAMWRGRYEELSAIKRAE